MIEMKLNHVWRRPSCVLKRHPSRITVASILQVFFLRRIHRQLCGEHSVRKVSVLELSVSRGWHSVCVFETSLLVVKDRAKKGSAQRNRN